MGERKCQPHQQQNRFGLEKKMPTTQTTKQILFGEKNANHTNNKTDLVWRKKCQPHQPHKTDLVWKKILAPYGLTTEDVMIYVQNSETFLMIL